MGFAPCPRCNLTTTYNEHDIATGAELRDSQGKLLGHIVRTFNARLVGAEPTIADVVRAALRQPVSDLTLIVIPR